MRVRGLTSTPSPSPSPSPSQPPVMTAEQEERLLQAIMNDPEREYRCQHEEEWEGLPDMFELSASADVIGCVFKELKSKWGLRGQLIHSPLKNNRFLLEFEHEGDLRFILRNGPWTHRVDTLLVTTMDGSTRPSDVDIAHMPIWVRIYDAPLVLLSEPVDREIGGRLGEVLEVHMDREEVKYDRVPRFYSYCGILGHVQRDCTLSVDLQKMRFPTAVRASPFKHSTGRDSYAAPGSSNARRFLHFDSEVDCGIRATPTRRATKRGGGIPEEVLMDPVVQVAIAAVSAINLGPGSKTEEEFAPRLG
ncbi:hypothetical protein D1007_12701 [Hordeum vulgare]|nr:hypothetical protein D1007_12701 [Hordeum vulgare]